MTTPNPARAALMSWDWRQQPDIDQLAQILTDLTGGQIHLTAVETNSDQFALTISTTPIDDDRAKAMWLAYWDHGTDRWEL